MAVQFILFNFANYSPSIAMELEVSKEITLACSRRSDSGERCEVKKAIKSRGGLGREVRERL